MRPAAILGLVLGLVPPGAAAPPPAAGPRGAAEFFEARVRPVLAEYCLACHGAKKHRGGLRLDSRAALLRGGDDGPVVEVGEPDRSPLIQAVRHAGELKMPPGKRLPPAAVDALSAWVKMGAPWPEDRRADTRAAAGGRQTAHWAFLPVRHPAPPPVRATGRVATPVDAFVLAALERQGLTLSPPADRRTLLRRVTYDLTGLPPTPEEVAAFEADRAPGAYERVVDRLLASPRYGERWGRYWLDVARYADTKGYVFDQERAFACSYSYRDYVIRAFNEDLPYDRFIVQQLAADRLPLGDDKRPLAAMGFLTLGNRFMNNRHDIIDDRIDVVTRGLLGLTVTCARCHDHKFDPIPTADYYSLYGVFASSVEPRALPVIAPPERTPAYLAYEKELQRREKKLSAFLDRKHAELTAEWRSKVADYLMAVYEERHQPNTEQFMFVIQPGQRHPMIVQRWRDYLAERRHGHDPVFAPWFAFAELPENAFAARASAVASHGAANGDPAHPVNRLVAALFAGKPPASMQEVAARYAQLFADTDRRWQEARRHGAAALADAEREQVRQVLYGPRAAPDVPRGEIASFILDRGSRGQLQQMRKDIEHYVGTSKAAPPRAMILRDAPTPYEPHVFVRGNPGRWGPAVPRRFLEVVAGPQRRPFTHGSGRLDLARAIADRSNPLTARVLVNRVWLHHFGQGLVRTPSDFGTRSDPPTHPELLDYLASYFMDNGWSIKKLHRLMVLSATYRQSSMADGGWRTADSSSIRNGANPQAIDPENRLLWRMNRQRLDFEALRDSLLAAAGRLDCTMGGASVNLTAQPFSGRRTVYGFIDRSNMPGLFRTFDVPNPDATSPQRYQTTVPLQALFLMNSPFVVEQARRLTQRPEVAAAREQAAKITALYRLVYGRLPDAEEVALGRRFVRQQAADRTARVLTPWEEFAQVLLLSNEFAFVD